MTINKISTSGIKSSDYSSARLSIVGSKDVREPISKMLEDRSYVIDNASFYATFDGLDFRCEISKTGSMKIVSIILYRIDIFSENSTIDAPKT